MADAKQCPRCARWAVKDAACNYVVCGRDHDRGFVAGSGCGWAWCFACGKKQCRRLFQEDGTPTGASEDHDAACCTREEGFNTEEYCGGGHNSHCPKRW